MRALTKPYLYILFRHLLLHGFPVYENVLTAREKPSAFELENLSRSNTLGLYLHARPDAGCLWIPAHPRAAHQSE